MPIRANSISEETWELIRDSYVQNRSIRQAALDAGVSPSTAAKYIKVGDPENGVVSVMEWMRRVHDQRQRQAEVDRIQELELHHLIVKKGESVIARIMSKVTLKVGKTLPDGSIEVDENELKVLLGMARGLKDYGDGTYTERQRLRGVEFPDPEDSEKAPTVNADMYTGPFGLGTRSRAVDVMAKFEGKHLNGFDPEQRAESESGLTAKLTAAALRKDGSASEPAPVSVARRATPDFEEESLLGFE